MEQSHNYLKYLKYKQKYFILKRQMEQEQVKNQYGGDYNVQIDKSNSDYIINQNTKMKNILILSANNITMEQLKQSNFRTMANLEELMKYDGTKINIDFINNFMSNITYDLNDNLEIIIDKVNKSPVFSNPDSMDYDISKTTTPQTGGGQIYYLEKKLNINNKKPEKLVLKVYNDSDFGEIMDYLPMNFYHIHPKASAVKVIQYDKRYVTLNNNDFETRDYNDLLKTELPSSYEDNSKLLVHIKSSNFINEVINFLIMEKIYNDNKRDHPNCNKFMRYLNFYIAKFNGVYRGFTLMEEVTGPSNIILNKIKKSIESYHNISTDEYNEQKKVDILQKYNDLTHLFLDRMLEGIGPTLELFKQRSFMFNHTDLKIENVFCIRTKLDLTENFTGVVADNNKEYGTHTNNIGEILLSIKEKDNLFKYEFILADFDKSSITYHGIRFHSDFGMNHAYMNIAGINPQQISDNAYKFWDDETRNNAYFYPIYNAHTSFPTEIFAQRYSPFPYYLGWDFQSLIISVLAHLIRYDDTFTLFPSIEITNKFKTLCDGYLGKNGTIDMTQVYQGWKWENLNKYDGSFDKMLAPLRSNITQLKIYKVNEISYVSTFKTNNMKLFLTPTQNKLILSFPFYPKMLIRENNWLFVNDTRATVDSKTWDLYGHSPVNNSTQELFENDNANVEHFITSGKNTVNPLISYTGKALKEHNVIVLTNRYTKISTLYEWDNMDVSGDFFVKVYQAFGELPIKNLANLKKEKMEEIDWDQFKEGKEKEEGKE